MAGTTRARQWGCTCLGGGRGSGTCDDSADWEPLSDLLQRLAKASQLSEARTIILELRQLQALGLDFSDHAPASPDRLQPTLGPPPPSRREQVEAILELEPLLEPVESVCNSTHVDLLEGYWVRHIRSRARHLASRDFFRRYAVQVSFNCKRTLLRSLRLASEHLVDGTSFDKVMPWSKQEQQACQKLLRQNRHQLDPATTRCLTIRALSTVKSIEDLNTVMSNSHWNNHFSETDELAGSGGLVVQVGADIRRNVDEARATCRQLERVYAHTILPIVRLARMGFNPIYAQFGDKCKTNELAQRWFTATVICHPLRATQVADDGFRGQFLSSKHASQLIVLEEQKDELLFDERDLLTPKRIGGLTLNQRELMQLLAVPIEDELWAAKYQPSKIDRLTSTFARNLRRLFGIEKLHDSVIFEKGLKFANRYLLPIILIDVWLTIIST